MPPDEPRATSTSPSTRWPAQLHQGGDSPKQHWLTKSRARDTPEAAVSQEALALLTLQTSHGGDRAGKMGKWERTRALLAGLGTAGSAVTGKEMCSKPGTASALQNKRRQMLASVCRQGACVCL